jgi:hypothetical protein
MHRHNFDQCRWGKDLHIILFQLLRLVDAWAPPDHVLTNLVLPRLAPFESIMTLSERQMFPLSCHFRPEPVFSLVSCDGRADAEEFLGPVISLGRSTPMTPYSQAFAVFGSKIAFNAAPPRYGIVYGTVCVPGLCTRSV